MKLVLWVDLVPVLDTLATTGSHLSVMVKYNNGITDIINIILNDIFSVDILVSLKCVDYDIKGTLITSIFIWIRDP